MSIDLHLMTRRTWLVLGAAFLALPRQSFSQIDPNNQEPIDVKIKLTFGDNITTATLYDNPSARDFASMLPLDLTIKDFGSNEKIAYLPRKLTTEGGGPFSNEQAYDLCYYVPWGNLAMFYAGYKHTDLIRLGRFEDGKKALHVPGEFPLRIERIQ